MIIKISIRATTMTTLTISTMITLITLITLISSNTCGRWWWCHLRPPPSPTDKIRQIWPFRQNTNWPPKFSAISPVVQWRDVIVAQRQLTERHFCEQEIFGPPKLFGPFCFFHIAPSNLVRLFVHVWHLVLNLTQVLDACETLMWSGIGTIAIQLLLTWWLGAYGLGRHEIMRLVVFRFWTWFGKVMLKTLPETDH